MNTEETGGRTQQAAQDDQGEVLCTLAQSDATCVPQGEVQRAAQRAAAERVRALASPLRRHWPFYVGVGAMCVFDLVEWPIALLVGVGHVLAESRHNELLHEIGEALEAAG